MSQAQARVIGAASAPTPARRSALSANRRALAAAAVVLLALASMVWNGVASTMVYYVTVDELLAQGDRAVDRPVRVAGRVVDGTLVHDAPTGLVRFRMADGSGELGVEYRGVKPDLLGYSAAGAYQDVVVEGRLGRDGALRATTLIVKHGPDFEAAPGQAAPAGRGP